MHIYGLTGGIGTGKSTVAKLLAQKGAVIVDADAIARLVVAPGSKGLEKIVASFGAGVLNSTGELDRPKLGAVVFADAGKRKELEAITHPLIFEEMTRQIAAAMKQGSEVVILDVPLLFEGGNLVGAVEKVIVVYAPAVTQIARVRARDGLTEADVRARLAAQLDIEVKRQRANFVIDNSGDLASTEAQVEALWPKLVS